MTNRYSALRKCLVLIVFLLIVACQTGWAESLPNAEIIFQTGTPDHPQLGFANADGTEYTVVDIPQYLIKPLWGGNGNSIFGMTKRISVLSGYPFVWNQGERIKICDEWWEVDQIGETLLGSENQYILLNQSRRTILLADFETCEKAEIFVDFKSTDEAYIFGISVAPDQKSFLYSRVEDYYTDNPKFTIFQQDLSTKKDAELGNGVYPVWSPDGKYIAFVRLDGIYVMKADGSDVNHIGAIDFYADHDDRVFSELVPIPRWSPDMEWIVYHRCAETCEFVEELSIYKLNINTGKEELIVHGGAYPDWHDP